MPSVTVMTACRPLVGRSHELCWWVFKKTERGRAVCMRCLVSVPIVLKLMTFLYS